jgi:hypothetical protein
VPTALYLYNSQEFAAKDYFKLLKRALNSNGWELISDFDQGLEGSAGNSFDQLATLIDRADTIVYAIGPLGTGKVHGNYEAGQVIQAQ